MAKRAFKAHILGGVGILGGCVAACAQSVGSVGAVNPATQGTPPGAAARQLAVGSSVVNRERIVTAGEGNAQIVFTDTSTMSIGRNSAVTIDRFVYDAQAGRGQQAVSIAKGAMRFVGGGVSHEGGAEIKTPVATVGVRGGVATLRVGGACGLLAMSQFGVLTVTNSVSRVVVSRPGFGVCVTSANTPIAPAYRIPDGTVGEIMAQIGSGPGQNGGSSGSPTGGLAEQILGQRRPPNDLGRPQGTPGLDSLDLPRTGNTIVGSGASGQNQPPPLRNLICTFNCTP